MSGTLYAEGGNYRFDILAEGIVHCRIWSRPDLDFDAGARLAAEALGHFEALAQKPMIEASSIVFDVLEAPAVCGPKTQAAIGRMIAPWEKAGRPMVMVVGTTGIKPLQMKRLVTEHAPRCGHTVATLTDAMELIGSLRRAGFGRTRR